MRIQILKKNVKNLTIRIKPTSEIVISAPKRLPDEVINEFIKSKESWIKSKLEIISSRIKSPKEYVSGENFEYLGRNYRLKVIENKKEFINLDKEFCYLYVKNRDDFAKKHRLIESWYRERAKEIFFLKIEKYNKITQKKINKITIRKMKTRWGSCNYNKKYINLNLELIKKPIECIEYVVFHELTHLIHPNHSKEFYNYIATYMPDWKKRKERLEVI